MMNDQWQNSYLFGANGAFIEQLYYDYLADANSVDSKWRNYFASLEQQRDINPQAIVERIRQTSLHAHAYGVNTNNLSNQTLIGKEADRAIANLKPSVGNSLSMVIGGDYYQIQQEVWQLVANYRRLGAHIANLDPLGLIAPKPIKELTLAYYKVITQHLNSDNEERKFLVDMSPNSEQLPLKTIVNKMKSVYCGTCAFQFDYVSNSEERDWLYQIAERDYSAFTLTDKERLAILNKLTQAEGLERYLHNKYVGQKRFSLEGGESLIPALERIVTKSSSYGVKEVVIALAHRGRLNTLVNIAGKTPAQLFAEFDGNYQPASFVTSGDVKYHKGFKSIYKTSDGDVRLTIPYNPSHLEAINPVLTGIVRALQDNLMQAGTAAAVNNKSAIGHQDAPDYQRQVLAIAIHGDAAFIGLGTNQGVLNLSQTRGYGIGGTVHIVINNQVGFTNAKADDVRSSLFCTDLAKMIEAPVIHVNGDDVESVIFAIDAALKYRHKFAKDIMIDLVCYRKYGHNEADDPTLTQPAMYAVIKRHQGVRSDYANKLINMGIISNEAAAKLSIDFRDSLDKGLHPQANIMLPISWYQNELIHEVKLATKEPFAIVKTAVKKEVLAKVGDILTAIPNADFVVHPTLKKLIDNRRLMLANKLPVEFGLAELLAYGSLLEQGINVRLTGEDSARGTFSHRQALWYNYSSNKNTNSTTNSVDNNNNSGDDGYCALKKLENNSLFSLYNSVLNEECVMGFEYGYGITNYRDLVIWEAQFGDFANGAQVIIDQFIASGETKWGILTNLVLMLPHGYDGQGSEHSSARLERYLQLAAENNLRIVMPTTAANMFHILRHKALSKEIKPLVILLSKRLLRYKDAMSDLSEFYKGQFNYLINDTKFNTVTSKQNQSSSPLHAKRILVCAGQIYYDLYNQRQELQLDNQVAIIRLEQLSPFPSVLLTNALAQYIEQVPPIQQGDSDSKSMPRFVWVQEEPYNQGAWLQIKEQLNQALQGRAKFTVISRPASAAPACGSLAHHTKELQQILQLSFDFKA